ncbi:SusC/RagA family TonB-linked outer membrane protein [Chitinophaga silvatica]|uniref:SusC/RagA family TonB-linked outer membrane protein n=1 Tax=Chitinophaga silvatica TaxID=2282649 RepID=A0A3E1Y3G6_9BACT|nr:SusC/RagA family TonB-linked outer membrane protein [Chitinophaga silvatica]RFS19229.1 SusC/RagA family TonB-linked outer membrane protein [Chitinophaga silvatica]
MDFTAFPKPYLKVMPVQEPSAQGISTKSLSAANMASLKGRRFNTASIFLAMRMTFALLFVSLLHVHAAVEAQTVSVSGNNLSVKALLLAIRQQTGYVAFYNQEMLADAKNVSINADKMVLTDLLKIISKDQSFRMELKENTKTIVITPRPVVVEKTTYEGIEQVVPKISGRVVDSACSCPLPGATIRVKGKTATTSTDQQGNFQIEASAGDVLLITFVGYRPGQYLVRKDKPVLITLASAISSINNVVVTGIFNKSKESYTGAAKTITAKELQNFQGRNIFVTIGNIDPSFYVVPDNNFGSDPNHLPDIQMRGNRNLPNIDQLQDNTSALINTPLIILDGFPISLQRMMDLNTNEIASITLLKDGPATAIYGSRGSNGVIVITTKEPVAGKLRLTYRGSANLSMPDLSSYHLLNAKDKLELERLSGFYYNATKSPQQNIGLQQYYNQVKSLVESGVNTDWISKPLRNGLDQGHSLRLEGGDQAFRYALIGDLHNINGVMKGSDRKTINGTVDLSYRLKRLNFRNSLTVGSVKSNESPWGSFGDYVKLNPYWSPYDSTGHVVKTFQPYNYDYWAQVNMLGGKPYANPMYDATLHTFNKNQYLNIINNFQVDWTPIDHFNVRGAFGISATNSTADNFKPADHSTFASYSDQDILRRGSYDFTSGKGFSYNTSLNMQYLNVFNGIHYLSAGVQLEAAEDKATSYSFAAEGFPDASIDFLGMALQYKKDGHPGGNEATTRRVSAVSNVSYTYNDRYFADVSYRVDGASQFGTNRRFAPFYSLGAGWNLQHINFIHDNLTFINRLKLRGSYGVTGNQSFATYQPLATYSYIVSDHYKNWLGAKQNTLGNPNLQWQKNQKYNGGVEAELFKGRISLQADVYHEVTSDLLSSLELPYSNGFTSYVENIGQLQQNGWEMSATFMLIQNNPRQISWSVTGNIAHNTDKIVKLSEAMKAVNETMALKSTGSTPNRIIREGASQNTIYAVRSMGIDPSTGRELYLNKAGEVTYNWNAADRVAVGVNQPTYRGNFSTLVRYKGFTMNASFGYRFGGQLYNQTLVDRVESADKFFNVDSRVFTDRWKQPGDKTFFRGINDFSAIFQSSRFVQNESTFTCQNINFAYNVLNKAWLSNVGLQALTLGANTGELFYWSTVKQERGLTYPFTRQVSFNVFATF